MAAAKGGSRFGAGTSSNSRSLRRSASRPAVKAATAAANVTSAGDSATAACVTSAACAATAGAPPPAIPVTAAVSATESRTTPGRRGARERVVRRSAGPSVALMTRAYVSLIASHAAPYSFMPKHHVSRGLRIECRPGCTRRKQHGAAGFAGGSSELLRGSSCSSGPGGTAAAGILGRRKADDQRVAAHRAGPFLTVTVRDVGTGRRLRMKLLEQPLLVA